MKKIILLCLFPVFAACFSNKQQTEIPQHVSEADVAAAVDRLMAAMVNADENILRAMLTDELVYAHSNGKVQSKSDLLEEIMNGERRFMRIETLDQTIQLAENAAVVQHVFKAETKYRNGDLGSLHVNVIQVWQLKNGDWMLLARQGYKL